jgi:hypothetical protein
MNQPLRLQPEQVRAASGRFTATGDDLLTALTSARRALDRQERPWGGDDPGEAFAREYLPAAEQTMAVVGLLAGALAGIAPTLTGMVDSTVGIDQVNASGFHSAGQPGQPAEPGAGHRPSGDSGASGSSGSGGRR